MLDLETSLTQLRCPETGATLERIDGESLEALNAEVTDEGLQDISGAPVEEKLDGALRPEGADVVYPVRGGVPNFLLEDRIPLPESLRE
jgi:uncharacterized protein YbaR (Trm112 family)